MEVSHKRMVTTTSTSTLAMRLKATTERLTAEFADADITAKWQTIHALSEHHSALIGHHRVGAAATDAIDTANLNAEHKANPFRWPAHVLTSGYTRSANLSSIAAELDNPFPQEEWLRLMSLGALLSASAKRASPRSFLPQGS